MGVITRRISVVTFDNGFMGLEIRRDGEIFSTLVSDFKPKNEADRKLFTLMVGATEGIVVGSKDLEKDEDCGLPF